MCERPIGSAVCAADAAVAPKCRTAAARRMEPVLLVQFQHKMGDGVHQPNGIENRFQPPHLLRNARSSLCRRARVCSGHHQRLLCGKLRIGQLSHGAHIVVWAALGPQRPHPQIAPVLLLSAGQEHTHGELRVFLRRFLHSLLQAADVLSAHELEFL